MGASSVTGTGPGAAYDSPVNNQMPNGALAAHIADTGNPHNTTALQVSADALGSAEAVQQNLTNHETDVLVHFTEASIDHDNIQNNGSYTHDQIDSHIDDDSNPHLVSLEQARSQNNQINGPIDANGYKIVNLPVPTSNNDAATKSYVDGIASGLKILNSVRAGTTANLTATYNPINLRLTATGVGAISVDNVSLVQTNRVLVKDQSTATQNGVYEVLTVGDGGNPWVLVRAADFDQDAELKNGTFVFVAEGDTNAKTGWVVTSPNPITLDSSDIDWSQFSSSANINAGDGLVQNGNAFDVNVDDSTIEVVGDALQVKNGGITDEKLDKSNIPISGFGSAITSVDLGNQKIINLGTPTLSTDAATKGYVDGSRGAVVTKTSNYTAVDGDIILCNTSGGEFTITLPPASLNNNAQIHIKKITEDGYAIVIDANGGEKIDNDLTKVIDGPYDSILIVSDGSNWWII